MHLLMFVSAALTFLKGKKHRGSFLAWKFEGHTGAVCGLKVCDTTGLPSSFCVGYSASPKVVSVYKASASLKSKFRALKTNENEIEALKITAMLFNCVFLC